MTYERITKLWHRAVDHTGKRFGLLTVLYPVQRIKDTKKGKKGNLYWACQCDCGKQSNVAPNKLVSGRTSSCGCLRSIVPRTTSRTHGHSVGYKPSRTFRVYTSMLTRCRNPNSRSYSAYGARGVSVCERWNTFENFLADMGEAPDGMSLDRIDPFGNYEPGNCRWATQAQQCMNKRGTVRLTIDGETKTAMEWAAKSGVPYKTVVERRKKGWADAECILPADTAKNGWDTRRKLEASRQRMTASGRPTR